MLNIDGKFALVVFSFAVYPATAGGFIYWLLPKLNGNRNIIFTVLALGFISILLTPIFTYLIAFSGFSEFISSVLIGVICCMFVSAILERRIIYALLNDTKQYEILYNPKESSFIRKKSEQALRVKVLSWYILIFHYGGLISLFAIYVCLFFKYDTERPIMVLCIFGGMLFTYMSIFRVLVKCENCSLNLFEFVKRELVKVAQNVVFNKYFICMSCHARYSLSEDVDLDELKNNYQQSYVVK